MFKQRIVKQTYILKLAYRWTLHVVIRFHKVVLIVSYRYS